MKKILFEEIFNFIDKHYHFRRLSNCLQKLKLNNVIDIGFHKGEFFENLYLKRNCKYYAFEANPEIYNYSKKKFYNKKLKLFNICIGDKVKKRRFNINHLSSTSSLYKNSRLYNFFEKILLNKKKLSFSINLPVKPLDDVIIENSISLKNCLLKIDVEGAEYLVLKGFKKKIKKISYILLENKFFYEASKKNIKKIDSFLTLNNFVLLKKFTYPLLNFEDRLYKINP